MKHAYGMTTAALAITAATAFAGAGHAASITINTITPQWANVLPSPGVTVDNSLNDTVPEITLRWGTASFDAVLNPLSQRSGYDFTPQGGTPFVVASPNTPFLLGAFNHHNFPITGTSLTSADLSVDIGIASAPGLINSVFSFTHNETPNSPQSSCPGDTPPCDDIVTVSNNLGNETFTIGGDIFTFQVLGFSTDGGTTFLDNFRTVEGQPNPAGLWGSYTSSPISTIPLPAAGWLLLAGIGGLGALRRFRKT